MTHKNGTNRLLSCYYQFKAVADSLLSLGNIGTERSNPWNSINRAITCPKKFFAFLNRSQEVLDQVEGQETQTHCDWTFDEVHSDSFEPAPHYSFFPVHLFEDPRY